MVKPLALVFLGSLFVISSSAWDCTDDAFDQDVNTVLTGAPQDETRIVCKEKRLTGVLDWDTLDRFSNLQTLILSNNLIQGVPDTWDWAKFDSNVLLDNNLIETIPQNWDSSPKFLSLSSNKISSVPRMWGLGNSRTLMLANNNITKIETWSGTQGGSSLSLFNNPITSIPSFGRSLKVKTLIIRKTLLAGVVPAVNIPGFKVQTYPAAGEGFGSKHPTGCYSTHFGDKCEKLVDCSFENGVCGEGCFGPEGDGKCTACAADGYMMPDCINKSPTTSPTRSPTASPTRSPTASPTRSPTASPTRSPIASSTRSPTASSTRSPTASSTRSPTASSTESPTRMTTESPTEAPTVSPTLSAENSAGPDSSAPGPLEKPATRVAIYATLGVVAVCGVAAAGYLAVKTATKPPEAAQPPDAVANNPKFLDEL